MKLLFDQNLSFKLCGRLDDLFPESSQAKLLQLDASGDELLWEYARANGFILVTQDADFAIMSALHGSPPKVIWLRCGNQPTSAVEDMLRRHADLIALFERDGTLDCLELR